MKRREFLKYTAYSAVAGGALGAMPAAWLRRAHAASLALGLSDPALQPKFANRVPDALAPGFKFTSPNGKFRVGMRQTVQMTGLLGPDGATPVPTTVWGYGPMGRGQGRGRGRGQGRGATGGASWPGPTFEVRSGEPVEVMWHNQLMDDFGLPLPHLLPVDTSLHWAYSLAGYTQFSIANNGVPLVPHLHGGHTDSPFDGNPEFFFSPGWEVRGPQWVDKKYTYDNSQPAGNLWYHDHALGITRLNVYAGLAGFYFIRDAIDTGRPDNPLGLPAWPYERAYAIQDRMFRDNGELFFPAFPGDPFYDDFITGEGVILPPLLFPNGGPTALAEFFGDHMVVNGRIWPKENVEPRHYRLRLLNGSDSRFMVLRFRVAASPTATDLAGASAPVPFFVIGSDQGLAGAATLTDTLVFEPGSRYDVVFDFSQVPAGSRVIMENIGGDAPFGGDFGGALAPEDLFPDRQTDRIMAFDVVLPKNNAVADAFDPSLVGFGPRVGAPDAPTRRLALFEGNDEFGRLQPLLGTAEPTLDAAGNLVNGAIAWHAPTTENPTLGTTEVWEIYNATADAHPIHLHLVHFEVMGRQQFAADVIPQPLLQHNGTLGTGFRLENIVLGANVPQPAGYVENAPKDMVTTLPGQVTRIKATFDKPGRYVWHCHILSHEDHEMMRVLHVGPGA